MGRNLLSCPFFLLLFLQGRALQSPLGVGRDTRDHRGKLPCTGGALQGTVTGLSTFIAWSPCIPQVRRVSEQLSFQRTSHQIGHTRTSWAP